MFRFARESGTLVGQTYRVIVLRGQASLQRDRARFEPVRRRKRAGSKKPRQTLPDGAFVLQRPVGRWVACFQCCGLVRRCSRRSGLAIYGGSIPARFNEIERGLNRSGGENEQAAKSPVRRCLTGLLSYSAMSAAGLLAFGAAGLPGAATGAAAWLLTGGGGVSCRTSAV